MNLGSPKWLSIAGGATALVVWLFLAQSDRTLAPARSTDAAAVDAPAQAARASTAADVPAGRPTHDGAVTTDPPAAAQPRPRRETPLLAAISAPADASETDHAPPASGAPTAAALIPELPSFNAFGAADGEPPRMLPLPLAAPNPSAAATIATPLPALPAGNDELALSSALAALSDQVRTHTVARGETVKSIARAYRVTDELIVALNRLVDRHTIRIGQKLLTVQGPFNAVVDKQRFTLDIYAGDQLVQSLPVGLGKGGGTPTGVWRVMNKLTNPSWADPITGRRYSAEDPANPIGEHWLGLEGVSGAAVGKLGFGIHGTVEPDSIGRDASLGCIRLLPPDVKRVYDLLSENGSVVEVR